MSENPFADWVRERPESIQKLMIDWPPEATVRAKPGVVLMVPAPGVEGTISSWFESGTLGVDAPLAMTEIRPATGEPVEAGTGMHAMEVRPDQLEIVSYATMPDGTVLDSDYIRGIVEEPPTVDLSHFGAMTEESAIAAGKRWLAELGPDGELPEGSYRVIYGDVDGCTRSADLPA